jgi:hypothetical protein
MVRPVQVNGGASPADPTLQAYGDSRRLKMGRQRGATGSTRYGRAEAQRWQGPGCGQARFNGQEVHLHPSSRCTPGAVTQERPSKGFTPQVITNDTNKASLPVNRLERHAGTLARAVLRGGGDGDTASLPDRPLLRRSRFRQQLMPGVDLTSNVKGCAQLLLSSSPVPMSSRGPAAEAEPVRHDGWKVFQSC